MIELEKYRGMSTRHTCPGCGAKKQFSRYVDTETGQYLGESVGRCSRESKCNYHYSPKQFFADNSPQGSSKTKARGTAAPKPKSYGFALPTPAATAAPAVVDYIPKEHLLSTLTAYDENAFLQFLFDVFPESDAIAQKYFIGTYQHPAGAYCSFPYIDSQKRVERAKLIRFSAETGKRLKGQYDTSSLSALLTKQGKLKENFALGNCFFGEHLLTVDENKPLAIVESEKTAVIASISFPEFSWLACGSKQSLKPERLSRLQGREIILYPDADGFDEWQKVATASRLLGLSVNVSKIIETKGSDDEKRDGFDLADYLINRQRAANEQKALEAQEASKPPANPISLKIESIIKRDIVFDITPDEFSLSGPTSKLTPDELEYLKQQKDGILCHLQQSFLTKIGFFAVPDNYSDFEQAIIEAQAIAAEGNGNDAREAAIIATTRNYFTLYQGE